MLNKSDVEKAEELVNKGHLDVWESNLLQRLTRQALDDLKKLRSDLKFANDDLNAKPQVETKKKNQPKDKVVNTEGDF